jgi:phosphoheptose isomerase
MLLQRIEQQFIESADLKYQCAQSLAPRVEMAVMAVMACLTGGGKVLTCGSGVGASLAQSFASAFLSRFDRDRPELAALALTADSTLLTSIAADIDVDSVVARPVRALGAPGDVVLIVARTGREPHWVEAVKAARRGPVVDHDRLAVPSLDLRSSARYLVRLPWVALGTGSGAIAVALARLLLRERERAGAPAAAGGEASGRRAAAAGGRRRAAHLRRHIQYDYSNRVRYTEHQHIPTILLQNRRFWKTNNYTRAESNAPSRPYTSQHQWSTLDLFYKLQIPCGTM